MLNTPFTTHELSAIISKLPSNKSPGPDGLTGEYHKSFQMTLALYLTNVCNDAASSSSLPPEMLKALIITLPKPGKEPT